MGFPSILKYCLVPDLCCQTASQQSKNNVFFLRTVKETPQKLEFSSLFLLIQNGTEFHQEEKIIFLICVYIYFSIYVCVYIYKYKNIYI